MMADDTMALVFQLRSELSQTQRPSTLVSTFEHNLITINSQALSALHRLNIINERS